MNDAFDPESAAANGVRLRQLLWMRCRDEGTAGFAAGRTARGASTAVAGRPVGERVGRRLDQGLRATDLLLQAGGFGAIVLDLGDTAPEQGAGFRWRRGSAFRQAAERTRCSLVVLEREGYAQSAAAVVLECEAGARRAGGGTVLRGFEFAMRRRERFARWRLGREATAATWQSERRVGCGRGRGCGKTCRETGMSGHLYACVWVAEFPCAGVAAAANGLEAASGGGAGWSRAAGDGVLAESAGGASGRGAGHDTAGGGERLSGCGC